MSSDNSVSNLAQIIAQAKAQALTVPAADSDIDSDDEFEVPEGEDIEMPELTESVEAPTKVVGTHLVNVRLVAMGFNPDTKQQERHDFKSKSITIRPTGTKGQRIAIKNPIDI